MGGVKTWAKERGGPVKNVASLGKTKSGAENFSAVRRDGQAVTMTVPGRDEDEPKESEYKPPPATESRDKAVEASRSALKSVDEKGWSSESKMHAATASQ